MRPRLTNSQRPIVAASALEPAETVVAMVIGDEGVAAQQADFLLAYYTHHGTLHRACAATPVAYRLGKAWRDEDPRMRELCAEIDGILVEALHEAYWNRAMDPNQKQPAYQIFALKSRDVRYSERPAERVAVQINLTSGGRGGSLVSLPVANAPKALTA